MHCRSHDNYIAGKDGYLEPVPGSKYASQQTVFDDLGQGVLRNAFEGQRAFIIRCIVGLTVDIIAAYLFINIGLPRELILIKFSRLYLSVHLRFCANF